MNVIKKCETTSDFPSGAPTNQFETVARESSIFCQVINTVARKKLAKITIQAIAWMKKCMYESLDLLQRFRLIKTNKYRKA